MPMRVLTPTEIEAVLESQRIVRIGFQGDADPYLVPVGYVWFEAALWVATTAGRKTEMAAANPIVSFQIDDERDAGFYRWSSVTGAGRWESVTDPEALARVQPHQLGRFADGPGWWVEEQMGKVIAGELGIYRIVPTELAGRTLEPPA
jgi:nitroimidazol reductase NimA-like FMN-containing flavoprotein (pyridoxamine 5'-phosphate oxidase superfamily)